VPSRIIGIKHRSQFGAAKSSSSTPRDLHDAILAAEIVHRMSGGEPGDGDQDRARLAT
jgi:hypothetical protein